MGAALCTSLPSPGFDETRAGERSAVEDTEAIHTQDAEIPRTSLCPSSTETLPLDGSLYGSAWPDVVGGVLPKIE